MGIDVFPHCCMCIMCVSGAEERVALLWSLDGKLLVAFRFLSQLVALALHRFLLIPEGYFVAGGRVSFPDTARGTFTVPKPGW